MKCKSCVTHGSTEHLYRAVNINELTIVLNINITRSMFANLNSNVNTLIQLILIALNVY